ncbi:MAG TPA: hypothetical protein VGQ62_00195 [Chloroflexota bacterium]|nr:hypothetical protein [Chloroflexota bacterium]
MRTIRFFTSLFIVAILGSSVVPTYAAPSAPVADTRFGVAEGFRNPGVMADIGAGWERLILPWDQIQPDKPGDFSKLGQTLTKTQVQTELNRGTKVAGLFQFTPDWAASNPADGKRAVPKNLSLAFDDPNNYFGQYVYQTVKFYGGQIDQWIIWNEPEFKPGDPGAGGSFTWLGSDEEFAQLLKVGYLAAKKANPNAVVSFPGTSYWIDVNSNRPLYYDRILNILAQDPNAAANNFYHDVVSLNLYRAPDDVYRVHGVFKNIQKRFGIDKPIWLTETNAMPSDDSAVPCADKHNSEAIKTTMDQQAAYAIQSVALASAAGYGKIEFYQMVDANPCAEPALWGLTRDDGTRRPVSDALKVAMNNFAGYTSAQFVPLTRENAAWSAWPDDASSLVPNWQVYQVAFDKPGNERVTALWNGDGNNLRIRVKKNGTSAQLVDRQGRTQALQDNQGWWVLDLPAATAYFKLSEQIKDPEGYHFIGGDPLLIVEQGVAPNAPVIAPSLGDPGSVARDFKVFVSPENGQTVGRGQAAEFFASTRGYEGFSDTINFSVAQWSTQRFPDAKDGSTLPLGASLPGGVKPGDTATLHFETAGADPGIYFLRVQADSAGQSKSFDLALVVN